MSDVAPVSATVARRQAGARSPRGAMDVLTGAWQRA